VLPAKQPQFGDEPPTDYFVILQPGESYTPSNTTRVAIFVNGKGDKQQDQLKPGSYVLELEVGTWPFYAVSDVQMRERWQRFGDLWGDTLLSKPMPFEVAKLQDRVVSNCNSR
jgi:hypothetical protein